MMKIVLKDPAAFQRLLILKGYTQRGLGRAIQIAEPYATQIAHGSRRPGPVVAKKIADVLGVAFDEIFCIVEDCKRKRSDAV